MIGLDRIPEVRTLRKKIAVMAKNGTPTEWMKELSRTWMETDPQEAGYLYVDGHVRVYHGSGTLPLRRYVSREKLCLRGTTDYWINDAHETGIQANRVIGRQRFDPRSGD